MLYKPLCLRVCQTSSSDSVSAEFSTWFIVMRTALIFTSVCSLGVIRAKGDVHKSVTAHCLRGSESVCEQSGCKASDWLSRDCGCESRSLHFVVKQRRKDMLMLYVETVWLYRNYMQYYWKYSKSTNVHPDQKRRGNLLLWCSSSCQRDS